MNRGEKPAEVAGKPPDSEPTPSAKAEQVAAKPSLETLRAKLDAAIVAEQWDVVRIIGDRIKEIERADVIDLATERAKRGG